MTIKQLRKKIVCTYGDELENLDSDDINCIVQEIVNKKKENEYKR